MKKCLDHGKRGMKTGYAVLTVGSRTDGTRQHVLAHRSAYCEHNDCTLESISGKVVRHTCDNPRCIEGEHLLLGTHADNTADMVSRGRHRKTSPSLRTLTHDQVLRVRHLHSLGVSLSAIGKAVGTTHKTVGKIVTGQTYKDVT